MALGKITIVIGAGIIGSLLSKEGGISDVTSFFSGALRIATKHLQQDKSGSISNSKPRNDTLLAQVSSLRKELQLLASSRSVTIVTRTRTCSRAYRVTTILIVVCLGYGYVRWKGWKLSNFMFVTRHGFSEACSAVGKQFEFVSSSITSAKRHLSSKIDVVDNSLGDVKEINLATKNEVLQLHGESSLVHIDVETVTRAVRNLESKMDQIDDGQNFAGRGLYALCKLAEGHSQKVNKELIEELPSSLQALEPPSVGSLRTSSLPPPSPSHSAEPPKILLRRPSITISGGGFKELPEVSNPIRHGSVRAVSRNPSMASNSSASEQNSSTPISARSGWLPSFSALTRSWSNAS